MQTYYNILVSVAKMMGADDKIAKKDMKDLLEFEIELAKVMLFPFYRYLTTRIFISYLYGSISM